MYHLPSSWHLEVRTYEYLAFIPQFSTYCHHSDLHGNIVSVGRKLIFNLSSMLLEFGRSSCRLTRMFSRHLASSEYAKTIWRYQCDAIGLSSSELAAADHTQCRNCCQTATISADSAEWSIIYASGNYLIKSAVCKSGFRYPVSFFAPGYFWRGFVLLGIFFLQMCRWMR